MGFKFYTFDNQFIEESIKFIDNFTGIVKLSNGDKYWMLNGQIHREDGYAVERADGTKQWCLNNKAHRTDGPAVEHYNGTKEWYLNGKQMTEEQHKLLVSTMKLKGLL